MAGTRSDLTPAVNTAMQAREGTGFCHCVEMTFGQAIRARPSAPTLPDTEVSWTGRGDLTKLQVYTSVDDGLTWQRVARSGDPIPKLGFGDGEPPVYSLAHAVTTNRRVAARLVFDRGASVVVDSFTIRATFEDGSVIEQVETGSGLGGGRLVNVRYDANVGGLIAYPDVSLRFHGNRGGVVEPTVHGGDDAQVGLHLSHGNYQNTIDGNVIEWQDGNDKDRKALAAMAFEGWFYSEKTTGVLCGWRTNPTRITWGTLIELVETSPTGAKVRFRTREWVNTRAPLVGIQAWQIDSPDDSVQLDRWHHVAASYDGFWLTLYLDGVVFARVPLKAATNGTRKRRGAFEPFGIVLPTNAGFVMGRHPAPSENLSGTANSFQGRLSEWRLYAKALTAGAILRRRFRRLGAGEIATMEASEGLRAYYRFDEGHGRTVPDATSNGLDLAWDQQQIGGVQLPAQMAWLPFAEIWRGFLSGTREVLPGIIETRDRSPGRQTTALSLDSDGEMIRVTDAPFDVTFDGKTFSGVGALGAIDAVQEAGDLTPTSARLSLSNIPASHISLALSARYLDRPCRIYQVTWDEAGAQLDPFLVFDGRLDELNVALGQTGAVEVSAESHLRNWRRPKHRRWNDESQRDLWPDDNGLEFLAEMVDREVWWPVRLQDVQGTTT